jgi:hypothetical protein
MPAAGSTRLVDTRPGGSGGTARRGDGLGWQIWTAGGARVRVEVLRTGELVQVVLTEVDDPADPQGRPASLTDLLLDRDGRCWGRHVESPSLLHIVHADGRARAVERRGGRSELVVGLGGVVVVSTAGFLDAAPPRLVAGIPLRVSRRRSITGLAEDLVRSVQGRARGGNAGVAVVQRVWPTHLAAASG